MQLATQQLQLQNGMLHVNFFLQLFVALQVASKIASCLMAFIDNSSQFLPFRFQKLETEKNQTNKQNGQRQQK